MNRHKSYHPYLEKNKERVRKDEERAAVLEADEEKQMLDAVSLRERMSIKIDYLGMPAFTELISQIESTSE